MIESATQLSAGCLIVRTIDGWLLHTGDLTETLAEDVPPTELAETVHRLLNSTDANRNCCVLAIDSADCFFTCAAIPDGVDVNDRATLRYELERYFPLDTESMTADLNTVAGSLDFHAVAVQSSRYQPYVMAIDESGLDLVAIVPRSFLIARGLAQWNSSESMFNAWLFDDNHAEVIHVGDLGIEQWKQFSDLEGFRLERSLANGTEINANPLIVVGMPEAWISDNELDVPEQTRFCDQSVDELLLSGASQVLGGRWGKWLNLRQGDLAPSDPLFAVAGSLRWLAIAAAAAFLAIILASWYRGNRIANESNRIRTEQRNAFKQAFPDQRTPVFLMREVRRQHARALGSAGEGDNVPRFVPASVAITKLYQGLSTAESDSGARFRMMLLDIEDGECSVGVHVKDTMDLGVIAKALQSVGFEVDTPASQQITTDEKEITTYESRIVAKWKSESVSPPRESN